MAYSEVVLENIRQTLGPRPDVREQRMFGGISFMVNEKLCISASNSGDLMVRCDPAMEQQLVQRKGARHADMRGKPMSKGWLMISADSLSEEDYEYWIEAALAYNQKIQ